MRDASTIGDAGAVCAVIDRASLTTKVLPVRVELAGTWSRGRTIVDRRDWSGDMSTTRTARRRWCTWRSRSMVLRTPDCGARRSSAPRES